MVAPPSDVKLSQIEQTMNSDVWGWMLFGFGIIGLVVESIEAATHSTKLFPVVSACHIGCLSLMLTFGVAALAGLIERGQWWNFATPVLSAMVAIWHFIYVQRKSSVPTELVDWRRGK